MVRIKDADDNVTVIERENNGNVSAIVAPLGQRTFLFENENGYLESIVNEANERIDFTYYDGGLLKSYTDPRKNIHKFFYDENGRLTRDEDPAGGYTELERTELVTGYKVTSKRAKDRNQLACYRLLSGKLGKR